MSPVEIPPYIRPHEVAKACGVETYTARRWLRRAGILDKLGGHCVVADSRLRERLPEVYDRVYAWYASRVTERDRTQQNGTKRDLGGSPTTE